MERIVYLDIDGVMSSDEHFIRYKDREEEDLMGTVYVQMWDIFPELMTEDLLNIILERKRDSWIKVIILNYS